MLRWGIAIQNGFETDVDCNDVGLGLCDACEFSKCWDSQLETLNPATCDDVVAFPAHIVDGYGLDDSTYAGAVAICDKILRARPW